MKIENFETSFCEGGVKGWWEYKTKLPTLFATPEGAVSVGMCPEVVAVSPEASACSLIDGAQLFIAAQLVLAARNPDVERNIEGR